MIKHNVSIEDIGGNTLKCEGDILISAVVLTYIIETMVSLRGTLLLCGLD